MQCIKGKWVGLIEEIPCFKGDLTNTNKQSYLMLWLVSLGSNYIGFEFNIL